MSPFQLKLRRLMNEYVHFVYSLTHQFPKEEIYGSTSQFRRASMSIILNYIEGYARRKRLVQLNFYEISYGLLQESIYIFEFALEAKWIVQDQFEAGMKLADEIGAMLWSELSALDE